MMFNENSLLLNEPIELYSLLLITITIYNVSSMPLAYVCKDIDSFKCIHTSTSTMIIIFSIIIGSFLKLKLRSNILVYTKVRGRHPMH